MREIGKCFLWVSVYAIAMAFLDAMVVAYIRGRLHITAEHVSLEPCVGMEIWRGTATIVMLTAVGLFLVALVLMALPSLATVWPITQNTEVQLS